MRLALSLLMSQVDLINTAEMGKGEFHACFVSSKVAIISLRLVIQVHYNDTLPDLSNVLQKQSWQVLSRLDIETIVAGFTISFALAVYTGRMD